MGIGEKLREAREQNNITLEELQETTKIQKRYLRAIEEGNFHILPGSFYARAFIKEYANAVGLNSNELLASHEDELPSIGEKRSGAQYTRIQRTRKSSGPSKASAIFSFLPTVIVVLLVIVIIALAIYFYKQALIDKPSDDEPQETDEFYRKKDGSTQKNDNNDNNEDNTAEGNEDEPDTEVIEEPENELVLAEAGTGRVPESTFEFIHDGGEVQLVIQASGKAWLNVDNDANKSFYADFITEELSPFELNITEEEAIHLNIGHAPYVEVRINDIILEYPVDKNERVHQKIKIYIKQNE